MARAIFPDERSRERALQFGRGLFFLSLAVVFVATIIGCIAVRVHLEERGVWPRDIPSLPPVVLLTLPLLAAASAVFEWAVRSWSRGGDLTRLRGMLGLGLLLTLGFLAIQAGAWSAWTSRTADVLSETEEARLAVSGFYLLTGLHAAHVAGGLIAVLWTLLAARNRHADTRLAPALRGCATYWHFLGVIWCVLLLFLWASVTV